MKYYVVALFLTAFVFGVVSSQNQGCKEGESWFDGCNNCICVKGNAVCTFKYCGSPSLPNAPTPTSEKGKCKPGDHWKQSCNNCFCTPNGAACTRKFCG